ncbi:hypothetical protein CDD82_4946 [Ophiocordyceps australis]|uniref:Uncharacterized protein n=1 Tax=Ophiocordyceps australis TaxID=1399860 RepID=A0A2C5Z5F3_9HYPO|nr:hypothetical protein CDD82_4946 [Ophiocordyceps australis]
MAHRLAIVFTPPSSRERAVSPQPVLPMGLVETMQPNAQHVSDELASLFSRTLTFNPSLCTQELSQQDSPSAPVPASSPITYSISQHYNHSAHIARAQAARAQAQHQSSSSPFLEPALNRVPSSEDFLRNHGIDAAVLTPSQLQLFRIAEAAQKLRLVELWSICPPNRGDAISVSAWNSTTLENEEQLARLRFENHQHGQIMSLDGTPVQMSNGSWSQSSASAPSSESEPYMLSGYQELMRRENERRAMENRSTSSYSHFDAARQQQQMDMATQYGAFQHLHATSEMDAMDVM